jgi:hypothetical protein
MCTYFLKDIYVYFIPLLRELYIYFPPIEKTHTYLKRKHTHTHTENQYAQRVIFYDLRVMT